MAKNEMNCINLIYEIKGAEGNKNELMKILCRYDIHDIKKMQHRILNYIFSIEEYEIKFKLFNDLLGTSILPIMQKVHLINSKVCDEKYLINEVKKEDYMSLIHKLEKNENNNVEELNKILHRYDLHDIKIIQHKILQYIFSIKEYKIRFKLFEVILKFNNLPILLEYYNIAGVLIDEKKSVLNQIKKESDNINVIFALKEAGRNNKEKIAHILYGYDIANIDALQSRILNYIMAINDSKIRTKFIDIILESNNMPITHECHIIINLGISQENYNKYFTRVRYQFCMMILEQSSFLKVFEKKLATKNEITSENRTRVLSHKGRNRIAIPLY